MIRCCVHQNRKVYCERVLRGHEDRMCGPCFDAYEEGAAGARAKLLAEVCAWLRTPELATRVGSRRLPLTVADAIEAKFKAILTG